MSAVNRNLIMHTLIPRSKNERLCTAWAARLPGEEVARGFWGSCNVFTFSLSFVATNIDFFFFFARMFLFIYLLPDEQSLLWLHSLTCSYKCNLSPNICGNQLTSRWIKKYPQLSISLQLNWPACTQGGEWRWWKTITSHDSDHIFILSFFFFREGKKKKCHIHYAASCGCNLVWRRWLLWCVEKTYRQPR